MALLLISFGGKNGHRVGFERGYRINVQKGTNVEHSFQNSNIQKIIYHINRYIYMGETTFKKRFSNHKKSFYLNKYTNETELSNEIWQIKNSGYHPKVKWEIVKTCVSYNPQTKRCLLCLTEKLEIAAYKEHNLLNKRDEIVSRCRHQLKYALARYDTKD